MRAAGKWRVALRARRRAVQATFGRTTTETRLAALERGAGLWRDRPFTGATYVDAVRGDLNEGSHGSGSSEVLDTTVVIDYLRGRDEAVRLLTELVTTDEVLATELVRLKLLRGLERRSSTNSSRSAPRSSGFR